MMAAARPSFSRAIEHEQQELQSPIAVRTRSLSAVISAINSGAHPSGSRVSPSSSPWRTSRSFRGRRWTCEDLVHLPLRVATSSTPPTDPNEAKLPLTHAPSCVERAMDPLARRRSTNGRSTWPRAGAEASVEAVVGIGIGIARTLILAIGVRLEKSGTAAIGPAALRGLSRSSTAKRCCSGRCPISMTCIRAGMTNDMQLFAFDVLARDGVVLPDRATVARLASLPLPEKRPRHSRFARPRPKKSIQPKV